MKKSKKLILITIVSVATIFSLFTYVGYSIHNNDVGAKAASSNVSQNSPCSCHSKKEFSDYFINATKEETAQIISIAKAQKIYRDYSNFLKKDGYVEVTNDSIVGFFKKAPIVKRKDTEAHNYSFYYLSNLKVNKPFLLSVPYINPSNPNKIAGIVFVNLDQHIEAYIIEETNNPRNSKNSAVDILIENNNGEIINASQVVGADSIIVLANVPQAVR